MRRRAAYVLISLVVLASRWCHLRILWVEECYPAAGAIQMLHGKVPHRDFWFDKPPLSSAVYLLWGAAAGWPLRLAGAVFVLLLCWLLYRFACEAWGEHEGLVAAGFAAFFLTFGLPSAVMALAPDLLMTVPHAAAVWLAWRGQAFRAGLAAGTALLVHPKALYVLLACLVWQWRSAPVLLAGFLAPNLALLGGLAAAGALPGYWRQVWEWGFLYSRDTFVSAPFSEGLRRTLNWAGFHAVPLLGAAWYWRRARDPASRRMGLWFLISLAGVAAGARFFPRYYLQLLPVTALTGARGLVLLGPRRALAVGLLLIVPLARFGPRYIALGRELLLDRPHEWSDLAMYQGSAETAATVARLAGPDDTILVWGYRPDIFVLTRMPAGAPFLDSQPLTGVIADRHLTSARPSAPDLAARNRLVLAQSRPAFLVDGLGPYNPRLAITGYPDLGGWLQGYRVAARTPTAIIYRRAP